MGSYYKTCFLTQFPIISEETILFMIIENSRYGRTSPCYSNGLWDVVPVPIYGKYDDYGQQLDDPNQEYKWDIISRHFKDTLTQIKQDKHSRKKDYSNPFVNSISLRKSIHEHAYAIAQYDGKLLDISFIMMHKSAFNTLSAGLHSEFDDTQFTRQELCDAVKQFQDYAIEKKNDTNFSNRLFLTPSRIADEFISQEYDDDFDDLRPQLIRFMLREYSEAGTYTNILRDHLLEFKPEDIVDAYIFQYICNTLRKQICPQGHEGSQSTYSKMHGLYLKAQRDIIVADETRYLEDNDDDEFKSVLID